MTGVHLFLPALKRLMPSGLAVVLIIFEEIFSWIIRVLQLSAIGNQQSENKKKVSISFPAIRKKKNFTVPAES